MGAQRDELRVSPVCGERERLAFARFGREIGKHDSNHRTLPDLLVWNDLRPGGNPWFEHGEAELFLARRGSRIVGRISAQIDDEHLKTYDDGAGFFGYFDCEDDPEVAQALLEAAADWCRARGMNRLRGPFSFSINEQCGTLVDGFDSPNYVMMPHNSPYYDGLLKGAGLEGVKDLYAWRYNREQPPEAVLQIADAVAEYPGLVVRPLNMNDIEGDLEIIMSIFNDAWSKNWGFVPLTRAEVHAIAQQFRLIADPNLCLIAEVDGKPAAMAVALPNVYEAMADLDGKLFPLGWAKLLYRLKARPPKTFRQILLGVRREYRGSVLGGLSVLLYVTIHRKAYSSGYVEAEASWTLSDNHRINQGMAFMGAEHYKTYRIYEREL
ncbi:N-acetyltransferase [Lujinxingia litoralis]|uniref:N-acetyltransferase n=1 Tax=Lujinxingia litoralis TaxID=2211119 RepID=A0A328CD44_9DELT|nr:N-acetyltransferase [Lujinxingia litoralis]RAL24799.1 N-acetyltransferase [Lujinxingia litoralis]